MEILAVIGLVGNIAQFVDFGSKLISKSIQSRDGVLTENINLAPTAYYLFSCWRKSRFELS